jgi:hypothetical protein
VATLLGHASITSAYNLLEDLHGHMLSVDNVLSKLSLTQLALAALQDQLLLDKRSSLCDFPYKYVGTACKVDTPFSQPLHHFAIILQQ